MYTVFLCYCALYTIEETIGNYIHKVRKNKFGLVFDRLSAHAVFENDVVCMTFEKTGHILLLSSQIKCTCQIDFHFLIVIRIGFFVDSGSSLFFVCCRLYVGKRLAGLDLGQIFATV